MRKRETPTPRRLISSPAAIDRVLNDVIRTEHAAWHLDDRNRQAEAVDALTTVAANFPARRPSRFRRGNRVTRPTAYDYRTVVRDLHYGERGHFPAPTNEAIDYIQDHRETAIQAELDEPVREINSNKFHRRILEMSGTAGIIVSEIASAHPSFDTGALGAFAGLALGTYVVDKLRKATQEPIVRPMHSEDLRLELERLQRGRINRDE